MRSLSLTNRSTLPNGTGAKRKLRTSCQNGAMNKPVHHKLTTGDGSLTKHANNDTFEREVPPIVTDTADRTVAVDREIATGREIGTGREVATGRETATDQGATMIRNTTPSRGAANATGMKRTARALQRKRANKPHRQRQNSRQRRKRPMKRTRAHSLNLRVLRRFFFF